MVPGRTKLAAHHKTDLRGNADGRARLVAQRLHFQPGGRPSFNDEFRGLRVLTGDAASFDEKSRKFYRLILRLPSAVSAAVDAIL